MKSKLIYSLTFSLIFFLLLPRQSSAQVLRGRQADEMVKGSSEVRVDEKRKSVSFIRLQESSFVSASASEQWLLKSVFSARPEDGLRLYKSEPDQLGFTHLRYRQLYKNIPVDLSMYIVHTRDGKVVSANGEFYPDITVPDQPSLTAGAALGIAKSSVHAMIYKTDAAVISSPELVVIRMEDGSFKLAYKTDVYAEKPLSRNWIYVDAIAGTILKKINRIETVDVTATATTQYSGTKSIRTDSLSASSYRLREAARGTGNGTQTKNLQNGSSYGTAIDFTNTSKTWPASYDNAALDAHYGAEKTYDHYFTHYAYNSYDNLGGTIMSYVHYGFGFVNAFWDGTEMTYGDGDGIQYNPLTSLEIVGHEITHGVTENSAGLIYSGESGALNESFSDIMGMTIRFEYDSAIATWYCGDQIVVPGSGGTPIRNMANPNEFTCADTYGGLYWNFGDVVHYNSGVQNFWYYLLTEGGTGVNDIGNSYTVNGIGLTDANAIVFRNLTHYLTPNATFADARTYAIQSATDLFGSCSQQVIQTTNAWYAVGVGGVFSNAVIAGFTVAQDYFCIAPATAYFSNNSINATSYVWNFGDGNTSSAANPSHAYTSPGVYTVRLIASGSASCGNADTMIIANLITVTNTGGPVSPNCVPVTISNCCGIGITRVQFNTINNVSGNAVEGYKDFTCSAATTVTAGDPYSLIVTTGLTSNENVKVWIDYNNDGIFNNTDELVFVSNNHLATHSGIIHTPATAVVNTPLRMRVMDENSIYTISSSCYNPLYGQAEDYSVSFIANTLPPIANFIASDSVINVGSTVNFIDFSMHGPTSWSWSFPGGTPSGSASQNPSVQYNTLGTYPVTLHVTNSFGADSMTKVTYIHVVNVVNMCNASSTTVPNGLLYDSGGPTGNYQNGENCSLLIAPSCATSITLSFSSFQTESCCDYMYVYDGPNTSSPLLLYAYGTTLPAAVTATSGKMYIAFYSDGSVTYPGFAASWTSVVASNSIPVPDFSISDSTPPLNAPVQFTDLSTNGPISWIWVFGDGGSSTLQNPAHAYTAPGTYDVTLLVFTCAQSAAITKTVVVQGSSSVSVNPDSLIATVTCGDSVTVPLTVYNSGPGDLAFSVSGINSGAVKILACTYGSDTLQEYPHTLAAINQYFTNYTLTRYSGTNAATMQAALAGKDVLLLPEHENSSATHYTSWATAVQNFVNAGGIVIVCGSGGTYGNRIFDLGLFTGTWGGSSSSTLTTLDTTDAITNNVPLSFPTPTVTFPMTFTNADRVKLVKPTGFSSDVVSYRHMGAGLVIYIGFDNTFYNNASAQLIANAASLPIISTFPSWVTVNPHSGTVAVGDSSVIQVTFSTGGLYAGVHTTSIVLNTNDTLHPVVTVPCRLTIIGSPSIGLSASCLNFGSIMQYSTASDTFYIRNNGCDTLRVTNLNPTLAAYTVNPTGNLRIPPYDSSMIIVHFSPATTGTFNGNLVILDNDLDTIVCLTGSAFDAPVMSVNPDTIEVTVSCGDTTSSFFTIYNSGLGQLVFNTSGSSAASGPVKILACTFGSDTTQEYPNTLLAINQYFTNYTLTRYSGTNVTGLQTAIAGKDVLLLPEHENSTATHYTSWATTVQNFVTAGGTVVVCGSGGSFGNRILDLGLFTGTSGGSSSSTLITLDTTDAITNNVPLSFSAPNATFPMTFTNSDRVQLVKPTGFNSDVVTYRHIGAGIVVFVGFDYFAYNNATAQLVANSVSLPHGSLIPWATVNPDTGTVGAGSSTVVHVVFDPAGMIAGTYQANLIVNSNDPHNPSDTVVLIMHVAGSSSIALSDTCLDFGTVLQFSTTHDTLHISNNGCDTLHVTGFSSTAVEFSASPSVLNVPPYGSGSVAVAFHPTTVGSFSATLHIYNSDVDTSICLSGTALSAPVISTVPTSFNVYLNACNDSITLPLEIYNTGGSNLTYTITGTGTTGMPQVLALTYGTDLSTEYPNTIAAINQYFTNYNLTTLNTTSASALQAGLVGKDIFLMTEPENGTPSVYAGFATVLQNFVTNGGTAILCGAYTPQSDCIFNTGLFSGTWGADAYGNTVNVVNTSTPITTGVTSSFLGTNGTYCLNLTNSNKVKLIDYSGMDVVSYRTIGAGKAIFLAFDYFNYTNDQAHLVANSMQWAASNQVASWIHLSSTSGTVTPGDSNLVYFTFNSGGLAGGTYHANVVIHSNDPVIPNDTIPCTLHVANNPCGSFTYTTSVCSGVVSFTSNSLNSPTSYAWTFGDGGTASSANPTHTYSSSGTYTVRLIVCNGTGCDTVEHTLTLGNIGGPVAASCSPITTGNCCGIGIYNVTFNNINNTTADGSDGYQDYTCYDTTSVIKGQTYGISVTTCSGYNENVQVWIDYNNDGSFSTGELVYSSLNALQYHTGTVFIPNTGVTVNTPLRMRVGSDYYLNPVPLPCTAVEYGQFEDYTVYVTFNVGVGASLSESGFNVYPNPFTGEASVEYTLDASKKVSVEVYNVIGEKVTTLLSRHEQPAGNYKYKLKVAEAGVYLVKLTTDDGSVIRRVVRLD